MEIHIGGGGKGGGRIIDDEEVYQAASENGRTVHCYAITVRPVREVGKGSGVASRDAVVGTGGN